MSRGHDVACQTLARHFLRDYRLSAEERKQEGERLAQQIQQMLEAELENLAHRLKT